MLACVAVGWAIVASGGSVKVDRAFLDALLRLPSESGNAKELARVVNFTYDWLTARGVHCVIETNDVGRLGLYASIKPGKKQDYFFVSHLDVIKADRKSVG